MKKNFLFTAISLAMFATSVNAQLKVGSNGKVAIGTSTYLNPLSNLSIGSAGNQYAALYVTKGNDSYSLNRSYAVYGKNYFNLASASSTDSISVIGIYGESSIASNNPLYHHGVSIGVMGDAKYARSGFNFGVVGRIYENGAAIYGSTSGDVYNGVGSHRYAGFFQGDVRIIGHMDVVGNMNVNGDLFANSVLMLPPQNLTRGTDEMEPIADRLSNLTATAYNLTEEDLPSTENATEISSQILEKVHYGLPVEQLKETFPELVYELEDGKQAVNYMELIPILVQTINEQNKRIEALEGNAPKKAKAQKATAELGSAKTITTDLKQIKYTLPEDAKHAELMLCDASGKTIRSMALEAGKADVRLNTSDLPAGIYLYSLVSGGKVVETKKMVVKH